MGTGAADRGGPARLRSRICGHPRPRHLLWGSSKAIKPEELNFPLTCQSPGMLDFVRSLNKWGPEPQTKRRLWRPQMISRNVFRILFLSLFGMLVLGMAHRSSFGQAVNGTLLG